MKDERIRIRRAQGEESAALALIRKAAILQLAATAMGDAAAFAWAHSVAPDRIQRAMAEHQVYIAEIAEEVIGWIEFTRNQVEGLYVQPARTDQGIGSALLAYAEYQIGSTGYTSICLNASLNAEQFYRNRGYTTVAERSLQNGLPMEKFLPAAPSISTKGNNVSCCYP